MIPSPRIRSRLGLFLVILVPTGSIVSACSSIIAPTEGNQASISTPQPGTATSTPFQPILNSKTPTPTNHAPPAATPTIPPSQPPTEVIDSTQNLIWLAPYLPIEFISQLNLPAEFDQVEAPETGQVQLRVGDQQTISQWIYALVAPYPTIIDQVSLRDIKQSWKGNPAGPFAGQSLLMEDHTYGVFTAWWGEPEQQAIEIASAEELLERAWDQRPSWGILPFESLEPGWKVLAIDGQSPLKKGFEANNYALTVPFSLVGDSQLVEELVGSLELPASNRDPDLLTTVAVTGVTALVRATAFAMHRNGITYPARDIGEVLRSADITHISNEIPFTPDCPFPNPIQADLRFCSRPEYIELLEEVGTDIVELTGDHFGDWGSDSMRYTLEMYEQRDWTYYGGGYNRKDARQARLIEHNGNRIAFIGCNGKGGGYATASDSQPGAVACDYDWMQKEIARLVKDGYQVIATFQHFEYYTYYPQPDQVRDFRALAGAGAAVVSGSQAHQPQGMEFYKNAFIHYGLGNLFFDQYHFCTDYACDDGFIDMHVFYDGDYLGNELIPIVFEDYARPRLMNQEEKAQLLSKIFTASNW